MPWLLLDNADMPHVGTLDIDLGLDAETLGDGEYATLVEALMAHGYQQRQELRRFQLVRQVSPIDGGGSIDIVVDFLMPRDAEIVKNVPPLVGQFAVQRASGADLATRFYQMVAMDGPMPRGGQNRVEIAVCSIPAVARHERPCRPWSLQAKGRLRYILLHPEPPRRHRCAGRSVSAVAWTCERGNGIPAYSREIRHRGWVWTNLCTEVRRRHANSGRADIGPVATRRFRAG